MAACPIGPTLRLGGAPKGKLPYIDDDGERVGDSTFIRFHIEKKYGFDFDRGLDGPQRAAAWAFEKLAEDNFYWLLFHSRWIDDAISRRVAPFSSARSRRRSAHSSSP